jgi:hypothetical protein
VSLYEIGGRLSESNGNGTPLRAALKAVKHRRRLVSRAVEASSRAELSADEDDNDEREEEEDDDPTGFGGGAGRRGDGEPE